MSTQQTIPALHQILGYDDEDLAYERRYLGRHDTQRPTRPLSDPTARRAIEGGSSSEDPRLPQAPRYIWKGTK